MVEAAVLVFRPTASREPYADDGDAR